MKTIIKRAFVIIGGCCNYLVPKKKNFKIFKIILYLFISFPLLLYVESFSPPKFL